LTLYPKLNITLVAVVTRQQEEVVDNSISGHGLFDEALWQTLRTTRTLNNTEHKVIVG
jgi:hypothetical protein